MKKFEDRMLDYIAAYIKEAIRLGYLRDLDIELTSNMIAGSFLRLDYYYFVLMKDRGKQSDVDVHHRPFFRCRYKWNRRPIAPYSSTLATALIHPALDPFILTGKQ